MFASAARAFQSLSDRRLLMVLLKSIGIAVVIFVLAFEAALYGVEQLHPLPLGWLNTLLLWLAPLLAVLLFINLGAPVTALVVSFFLEEIAEAVEARDYPNDPKARGIGWLTGFWAGLRIAAVLVLVNIMLLPLHILLPGISGLLTLLVDGWFLGRQAFELVAMRHLPRREADALRRRFASAIFLGGSMIAVMAAIPLINVLAPFFGTALMVHAFKRFNRAPDFGAAPSPSGVLSL